MRSEPRRAGGCVAREGMVSAVRAALCGPHHFGRVWVASLCGAYAGFLMATEPDVQAPAPGAWLYLSGLATMVPSLWGAMNAGTLAPRSHTTVVGRAGTMLALSFAFASLAIAVGFAYLDTDADPATFALFVAGWVIATSSFVGPALFGGEESQAWPVGYERIYIAHAQQLGREVEVRRTSRHDPQRPTRSRAPLDHAFSHSIPGFDWGLLNDGAFDLARSILVDACGWSTPPARMVHQFTTQVIARLPRDHGWTILVSEVGAWSLTRHDDDPILPAAVTAHLEGYILTAAGRLKRRRRPKLWPTSRLRHPSAHLGRLGRRWAWQATRRLGFLPRR